MLLSWVKWNSQIPIEQLALGELKAALRKKTKTLHSMEWAYQKEASPASEGRQGLFAVGLHRCKSYLMQLK